MTVLRTLPGNVFRTGVAGITLTEFGFNVPDAGNVDAILAAAARSQVILLTGGDLGTPSTPVAHPGILSMDVDSSGNLIVTYGDGSTQNLGALSSTAAQTDSQIASGIGAHNVDPAAHTDIRALIGTGGGGGGSTAPAHAGARAAVYEQDRTLYRGDPGALLRVRAEMAAARNRTGLARVAFVGDSLTAGTGSVIGTSDAPSRVGDALAATGYRVGEHVYLYNGDTRPANLTASSGWSGSTKTFPWVGYAGTGQTITYTSDHPGTVVEIVTAGSSAPFTYSIDGGAPATFSPNGTSAVQLVTVTGLPDTVHTVVINSASGGTAGQTYIAAVAVLPAAGVAVANAGIYDTTTGDWLDTSAGAFAPLGTVLSGFRPDIVFVGLGVNDAKDAVAPATYRTNLASIVSQVVAAGAEPVLVAENRPDTTVASTAAYNAILSAAYDVADSAGVALLDVADRLGLHTAYAALGLAADTAHLTATGYTEVAHAEVGLLDPPTIEPPDRATARAYASSTAQSIANTSQAPIDLNAVEFNLGGGFTVDLAANTITAVRAGPVMVIYEVTYQGGSAGSRYASVVSSVQGQIRLNGVTSATDYLAAGTAVLNMAAGESLHMEGYCDGGTATPVRSDGPAFTGLTVVSL